MVTLERLLALREYLGKCLEGHHKTIDDPDKGWEWVYVESYLNLIDQIKKVDALIDSLP